MELECIVIKSKAHTSTTFLQILHSSNIGTRLVNGNSQAWILSLKIHIPKIIKKKKKKKGIPIFL